MDAEQIGDLKAQLSSYLREFDDCFPRCDTAQYFPVYVEGQLSDLSEKSCEPIALAAGIPPRNLQQFLSSFKWMEEQARRRVHELVVRDHFGPNTVGVIDETSDVKKGDKTPGVQRQWCGTMGKKENCMVTVHLGYAQGAFHCLLDGDLYLPESWANDRERCRAAGIPDEVVYRPKWLIALDLYDRAGSSQVKFDWLTFDEGYGSKPGFLRGLQARNQVFVGEVPRTFTAWSKVPDVTRRRFCRRRGRGRKTPRIMAGSPPAITVENMLKYSPVLRDQKWVPYRVKEGDKGPIVWEAKHTMITVADENGLPGMRLHLVVARNALDHNEVKYFVSNATEETSVQVILLVGFSRWRVERCFEDQKQEVGLDQWEGRSWLGLTRHLILTSISYLFLAKVVASQGEKKSGTHRVPGAYSRRLTDPQLVACR